MTYKDNENRKVYNIDFDGTLTTGDSYEVLHPNNQMIRRVQELYFSGNIIIIWSARMWSNATRIAAWLIEHEIPFHGMMLGKGGTDYYIDDKAINSTNFLKGD